MAKLIYIINISLDGYVADRDGSLSFTEMTPEVFSTITSLVRGVGTHVYGRRMYEMMAPWETAHLTPDAPSFLPGLGGLEREFATAWRGADKLVISTTLTEPTTARTRIATSLDVDAIRQLKREQDVNVGGPMLAGAMIAADLVDEFHAFVAPFILGGGTPWLPPNVRLPLALLGERRLGSVVHLHYGRR